MGQIVEKVCAVAYRSSFFVKIDAPVFTSEYDKLQYEWNNGFYHLFSGVWREAYNIAWTDQQPDHKTDESHCEFSLLTLWVPAEFLYVLGLTLFV